MSEISDEMRRFADAIDGYTDVKFDRCDGFGCVNYLDGGGIVNGAFTTKWFRNMAGRIDAEMVELPKDADGEPIHIGDVMWQKGRITKRACKAIMGDAYVMLDGIQGAVYAKGLTHYHAPTVEDVLREFADELWNRYCIGGTSSDCGVRELEAEYAAKLTLRGDE